MRNQHRIHKYKQLFFLILVKFHQQQLSLMIILLEFILLPKNLVSIQFMYHALINLLKVFIYLLIKKALRFLSIGSPFPIRVERPRVVQISGECFPRLRLDDLGLFRIHCHGQRGAIQAKIFSKINFLSLNNKPLFTLKIFRRVIGMILDKQFHFNYMIHMNI